MLQVPFWQIALAFGLTLVVAGVLVLGAVALGAYAVFRTKREGHETLFQLRQPQGTVGSLDEAFASPEGGVDPVHSLFNQMEQDNLRFLRQYQESKSAGAKSE